MRITDAEVEAYLKGKGLTVAPLPKAKKPSHVVSAKYNSNGTITVVLNVRAKSELGAPTEKGNITVIGGSPVVTDLKYGDKNICLGITGWVKAS